MRARQWAELVLLPAAIAILGRRAGWLLMRSLSGWRRLFRTEVNGMVLGYRRLTRRQENDVVRRRIRAHLLQERSACFRSRLLGHKKASNFITRMEGGWPDSGPFLAFGLHQAGGFVVLDQLARNDHKPVFLHTPAQSLTAAEQWLAQFESRQLARLADGTLLVTGGSYERMRQLTSHGRMAVALVDTPPEREHSTMEAGLLGHRFRLRSGLFQLAADLGLPIAFFYTHLEVDGTYSLVIRNIAAPSSPDVAAQGAFDLVLEVLTVDPTSWLYLNGIELFIK